MIPSSGSRVPRVFLDTCVISGHVNKDMRPVDQVAFDHLAGLVRESRLTFGASTVAREEIDRLLPPWRVSHVREYETLRIVRGSILNKAHRLEHEAGIRVFSPAQYLASLST